MIDSTEDLVADDEGREAQPYQDEEGIWSVGIGHNLEANGVPPGVLADHPSGLPWPACLEALQARGGLAEHEIDLLFSHDLTVAATDLQVCLTTASLLDPARYAAMIDMAFNLGRARLSLFDTFLNLMASSQYQAAAADLLKTKVAQELHHRYTRLASIINTGAWPLS